MMRGSSRAIRLSAFLLLSGACSDESAPAQDAGTETDGSPSEGDGTAQDGSDQDGASGDGAKGDGAPADGSDGSSGDGASEDGASGDGAPGDGDDGLGEIGPHACLPAFKDVCSPDIVFSNDEPNARGAMFDRVIPDPEAMMKDVACTVCSILFRTPEEIPEDKRHDVINLRVRDNENLADAGGNTIRFDVKHIERYTDPAQALLEFHGVLVHETTHLYQHYGNGGLGEGMADFVRIRVGLYEPGRRRAGGAWTDPYTTSGFFFSWLAGPGVYHDDGRDPHDVDVGYLINKTIGERGPDAIPGLLQELYGESVDTLWGEYQDAIR